MIYVFETLDGEKFVLDVEKSRWGRASSILAAPSIKASENAIARYVYSEEGELIPMGGGVYNLEGRLPLTEKASEEEKKAPGAGLSTVGVLNILYENSLQVYLKPNAVVKDGSFECGYMQDLELEIRQHCGRYGLQDEQFIQGLASSLRKKYVNHVILQEPPKIEEEKKIVEEKS